MKKRIVICALLCTAVLGFSSCRETVPADIQDNKPDSNVFRLENGLYDIGQYKSDEKYEYFTGEPQYEFTPRDDYGPLLPFSGEKKQYHTQNGYAMGGFGMDYSKYGLCTTDGKVVVEPVYAYINSFTSEDGFSYYNLNYENDVVVDEDGNLLNGDDVFMANRQVIIPKDGSWSLELESGSYVGGAGDGIILVCKNDYLNNKNEFKMYDYDGNFLFSIDSYEHMEAFSNGYAVARIYPEYSHDTKDNPVTGVCVYIDKRGNVALEGFTDGTSFNKHGVASVQFDGEKYALINTDGETLTEIVYDSLYMTGSDGYFQGFVSENNERHVFGNNGELLGVVNAGTRYVSVEALAGGELIYSYYDSKADTEMWYRLSDNTPIVCKENGKMPNDYSHGDNFFIYKEMKDKSSYNEETKAILFDIDGKTIAKLDRYRYSSWIDNETQLMGYVRSNPDVKPLTDEEEKLYGTPENADEFVIFDIESGEEVCVFENCHYAVLLGNKKQLVAVSRQYDGETEYEFYDLASKSTVRGFEKLDEYKITGVGGKEYLTVTRQDSLTLYDEDFNIVLRKYLDTNV